MNTTMWKRFLKVKPLFGCAVLLCVMGNLLLLLYYPPKLFESPCPLVISESKDKWAGQVNTFATKRINCSLLYHNNDPDMIPSYKWCHRYDAISDSQYVDMASNCSTFLAHRGYSQHPVSEEEKEFPLAFSILMHVNVEQMERMLRAIYRPQNIYCIHVDAKAGRTIHSAVHAIAACLPNVFVASRKISVHWAEFSVLEAELVCLNDLWKYQEWKYYINLAGTEFPLRTNLELVQILKAYNGGNEIDGSPFHRPFQWTLYSWKREFWRTNTLKSSPPHGFIISKGSTHVAASRDFVDFALHDKKALDLLDWMKDVRCPDEHFFQTLNNNPHLGAPGAYAGNPDLRDGFFVRYKIWKARDATCHGKWVDFICVLGSGDLPQVIGSKHLFVNKLSLDMDPVAFQCLEQWYNARVQRVYNPDFDLEFYRSRKLVQQHV